MTNVKHLILSLLLVGGFNAMAAFSGPVKQVRPGQNQMTMEMDHSDTKGCSQRFSHNLTDGQGMLPAEREKRAASLIRNSGEAR